MRYGIFITFAGLLQTAFSLPNYPIPTSNGYAPAPIHTSDGYAPAPKPRCTYVDEVEYEEKCEEYKDRVCYTSYDEHCEDVYDQTCRSFVSKSQTRKCFNVTETVCTLKEDISYEVIDAVFTVQKCSRGSEKVCDTIYDMEETKKQRKECIKVPSLVCTTEEKTVHEKTCRTLTKFDCDTALLMNGGYEPAYSYDSRGQQSNEPEHQEPEHQEPSYQEPSSYDTTGHTTHSHGETKCKKHEETRCNTTPRQITSQSCKKSEEKVCEQLTERHPAPYQKAHCRNEVKKLCRVEQKTQPKQIKKYHYKKVCSPLVKKVCDIWDDHKLVPTCVPTVRHICHHKPKEHCEDVPKNHCYKIPRTVRKENCDNTEEVLHPTDPHTASYQ